MPKVSIKLTGQVGLKPQCLHDICIFFWVTLYSQYVTQEVNQVRVGET